MPCKFRCPKHLGWNVGTSWSRVCSSAGLSIGAWRVRRAAPPRKRIRPIVAVLLGLGLLLLAAVAIDEMRRRASRQRSPHTPYALAYQNVGAAGSSVSA